jgi:predicted Zn finger-like uncharacterized protein
MIVKCERCQTRFKIPDEKVTDKGVKVRCTKCQNTFRVTREGATAGTGVPPAPPAAGQVDPFARFGVAKDPKSTDITKPGYYEQGVEATRPLAAPQPPVPPWNSVDTDMEEGIHQEPTRVAPVPLPPPGPPAPSPFDLAQPVPLPGAAPARSVPATPVFGAVNPAGPVASAPAVPLPAPTPAVPLPAPAVPLPAPVTKFSAPPAGTPARRAPAPAPAPAALGAPGEDPFSDFVTGPGLGAPPLPGFDDLPVSVAPAAESLRRAATAPPPASPPTGAVALGPVRPAPPVPAPTPGGFDGDDPFASIDIDLSSLGPPAARPAPTAVPPPAGEDPFASIDVSVSPPGPVSPAPFSPAPVASASQPPASLAPAAPRPAPATPAPPGAQDLFDLGPDPFGEQPGVQATDTGRAALLGMPPPAAASDGLEALDALDGLGPAPGPAGGSGGGSLLGDVPPAPEEAQEFKVTVGRVGPPPSGPGEAVDLSSVPKPSARPEDVGIPQGRAPSRARKVTGLVANLVVAAVLVVALGAVGLGYLREGRVDLSVLSPGRLRELLVPAARPLVAVDVSNGLYETQGGRPVFFIRGEAENRSGASTRVRVRAALYDGAQRVRSAEALAGAVPSPEELYAVGKTEAAGALRQRLDAAAATVAPGARAPFVVMFHEYPADLAGFRLEVTLESAPPAGAGSPTE